MKFGATKTADQLDLQALHRVRERLVRQRTGIINQIRALLLERGIETITSLAPFSATAQRLRNFFTATNENARAGLFEIDYRVFVSFSSKKPLKPRTRVLNRGSAGGRQ
jgi:transposase